MHKEPLLPNQESIKRTKRKSKKVKKSKHKHNYVYYKEYIGDGKGIPSLIKKGGRYIYDKSAWNIYHLCSICGKDSGNIYLFISEKDRKEAVKDGIDITIRKEIHVND